MAVVIFKPGENQDPTYTGECHVCGCVFTCKKGDMKCDDGPFSTWYVKCPTKGCYGQVTLDRMTKSEKEVK